MFSGTSKTNFTICNLKLNGNRDNITGGEITSLKFNGFYLETCTDFLIENVTFDDMRSDDVRCVTNCTRGTIRQCTGINTSVNQNYDHIALTGCSYMTVDDCYFTKKSCGVYVGPGSDYNIIQNNRIYSTNDGEHIYVYQSSYNLIESNICIGKQTHAGECISINSADNVVRGNYVDPQGMSAGIGAGTDGGEFATGTVISNNRVMNAENEGISISQINCTISGNVVTLSSRWGIYTSAAGTTVSGNVVSSSGAANIRLQTGSDGSTVIGNHVTLAGDAGGIQVLSNYNTVTGNTAYANAGAGIAGGGNNNIVSANTCVDNNESGIYFPSGNYNQIIDNTSTRAAASQNYGILFNSGTGNTISGNVVFNNGNDNIRTAGGVTLTTINDNDVRGTGNKITLNGAIANVYDNKGYIAPGEIRTISGSITGLTPAGIMTGGSIDNPFGQAVRVLSVDIEVTTQGAASGSMCVGIGSSATTDYATIFSVLPSDPGTTYPYFYNSTKTATYGVQTNPINWATGGGNRYLNFYAHVANAAFVATYTITVMGN